MEKGRLSDFAAVERDVLAERALLWLAWNGETIKAAAVTRQRREILHHRGLRRA